MGGRPGSVFHNIFFPKHMLESIDDQFFVHTIKLPNMKYEWDSDKAAANLKNHGVSACENPTDGR